MDEPIQEGWWVRAENGDKIVCISERWNRADVEDEGDKPPVIGGVYTVSDIKFHADLPFVTIFEISDDCSFLAYAFRPVQNKSTDAGMAVFREILDRKTLPVRLPEKVKA